VRRRGESGGHTAVTESGCGSASSGGGGNESGSESEIEACSDPSPS
jgi:hypothetical protein